MPHNTGFVNNDALNSSQFHPVQEAQSLPVWLRKAGYQTMLAGKVGMLSCIIREYEHISQMPVF